MRGLDDVDRQILSLLLADGRQPYSEIAEAVDLSAPAVSDRVERLQEIGLIRRFTVDLDRSMLREGVPVLVDLTVVPGRVEAVRERLDDRDDVEHLFSTADERVVFTATVPEAAVYDLLADAIDTDAISEYEVDLLRSADWEPSLGDAELAPACAECGNTVTSEGETASLGGERYQFCCPSCHSRFVDRFEELQDGAES